MKRTDWLQAKDLDRRLAVAEAAQILLGKYRFVSADCVPIDLNRLAGTLDAVIIPNHRLREGARLLPTRDGFKVLISHRLPEPRFRLAVAHELAHTLFYTRDGTIPTRIMPLTDAEEFFCYDVARRLLLTEWQVESVRVCSACKFASLVQILTTAFRLSRPVAARIMFEDYALAEGVAGRWRVGNTGWHLKKGDAYASATLRRKKRQSLRGSVAHYLETGTYSAPGWEIVVSRAADHQSAFVYVGRVKGQHDKLSIQTLPFSSVSQLPLPFALE